MDFITHTLAGVGAARLICPRPEWRPQLMPSAVLGGLLMDGDSFVFLFGGINAYGRYHRVATHSVLGLIVCATVAACVGWFLAGRWRRYGFFVCDNLIDGATPARAPLRLFFAVAAASAFLHFCGDAITGYGNMLPFWPASDREVSLHAVRSFDWLIFGATLGWHAWVRYADAPRLREGAAGAAYGLLVICYVACRFFWGHPTSI